VQAFALVGTLAAQIATGAFVTWLDQSNAHQRVIRGQWPQVLVIYPEALTHMLGDLEQSRINGPMLGNSHNHVLQGIHFHPQAATTKFRNPLAKLRGSRSFVVNSKL
jgi:hypothetical protein